MKKCSINIPEEGFRFQTQEDVLKGDGELVNSYDELYEKIAQLAFVNPNLLLFYRGQKEDYKIGKDTNARTSILPSMYRNYSSSSEIKIRWEKLNNAEKILASKLREKDYKKYKLATRKKLILWSIIQHYEVTETPLVDITQSLRVACSFAVLGNTKDFAYIYVIGMPYYTNRISINSEEYLTNIRLLSIAPPDAKRPYLQEGFLAGEDEMDENLRVSKEELDFARRLVYKFKIPVTNLSGEFLLTEEKLLPQNDPIAMICQEVKEKMNMQTFALENENANNPEMLSRFMSLWQDIEDMLISNFQYRDSTGRYNLVTAIKEINDPQLSYKLNYLRNIRNQIVHGKYKETIDEFIIFQLEDAKTALSNFILLNNK